MANKKEQSFSESLEELTQLVESMESGDLSLEDSLTAFEKGVELTRKAQLTLAQAEKKVQILLENKDGEVEATPFEDGGDDTA